MPSTPLRRRFDEAVAAQIRSEVLRRSVTLNELSTASGLSRTEIQRKLSGRSALSVSELGALASTLGTTSSMLIARAEKALETQARERPLSHQEVRAAAAAPPQTDAVHEEEDQRGQASRTPFGTEPVQEPPRAAPTTSTAAPATAATTSSQSPGAADADGGERHAEVHMAPQAGCTPRPPYGAQKESRRDDPSLSHPPPDRAHHHGTPAEPPARLARTQAADDTTRPSEPASGTDGEAEGAPPPPAALNEFIAHINRRLHEVGHHKPANQPGSLPGSTAPTRRTAQADHPEPAG